MKFRRTVKAAEPTELTAQSLAAAAADPRRPAGKGRPTPKRRDVDPRARGPVPPPPTTRREAYKRTRLQGASTRSTVRESAGRTEDALPGRDRGPARSLVRDIVDSRRNAASFFLPFAGIFLVGYFINNPNAQRYLVLLWTVFFVSVIVDSIFLSRRIKKETATRFPKRENRGLVFYGIQRSTMIRRWRFPRPSTPTMRKS